MLFANRVGEPGWRTRERSSMLFVNLVGTGARHIRNRVGGGSRLFANRVGTPGTSSLPRFATRTQRNGSQLPATPAPGHTPVFNGTTAHPLRVFAGLLRPEGHAASEPGRVQEFHRPPYRWIDALTLFVEALLALVQWPSQGTARWVHQPPYPPLVAPPDSCLLYTSPSPRDATLSRMPSSA